ncbi:MAG: BlaI/MecI/CopY family transcriptional regulator [Thaumarchaeota archaeon]|nr:BlaI/MecI/CopY family transcriptional regulator [Nitrososphaerota archaeon]
MRARGRKRVKFEMTSENGDRIVLIFEGNLSREKLMQLADLMELYGGSAAQEREEEYYYENSKLSKVARLISKYFPFGYFTSREVIEAYMAEYREPITLSTVSTYLSRLSERGFLERSRSGNTIRYRLAQPKIPRSRDISLGIRGYDLDAEP